MISIKRLILASLFTIGSVAGIAAFHGFTFHSPSVTPAHVQFGDGNPVPPSI